MVQLRLGFFVVRVGNGERGEEDGEDSRDQDRGRGPGRGGIDGSMDGIGWDRRRGGHHLKTRADPTFTTIFIDDV